MISGSLVAATAVLLLLLLATAATLVPSVGSSSSTEEQPATGYLGAAGGRELSALPSRLSPQSHVSRAELQHNRQLISQESEYDNLSSSEQQLISIKQQLAVAASAQLSPPPASQQQQQSTSGSHKQPVIYTNQFVIQVKGGEAEARRLAKKHGFLYLNHILADFYHLEHQRLSRRSASPSSDLAIGEEPQVSPLPL